MGNIPGADERIARILGQKQGHAITREDGTEPLVNRMPRGSVDASVPSPVEQINREAEAQRSRPPQPATEITMPSGDVNAADVVEIGVCRIYPNPLAGTWEGVFTASRGGTDPYVVEVDGQRVTSSEALGEVYRALKLAEQSKKASKR